MTTVRGITSRVDIVWSSDGVEIVRREGVISITTNSSALYTDYYTISQLGTADDDRVYQCEVVINRSSQISTTNSVTLDVTGMLLQYSKLIFDTV